ncbi:MAG: hypothetical protein JWN63_730 [Candidatus Acidoferrum typicum]|nr:hypothetical protein [Candidatus Acidoferrum typicum]
MAFITEDGHFKGSDGNFHPDLLQDLATHKVELLYYDSIPKFVRANSLELSIVMADEIAQMVKESVVADLVTDRFKRVKFEDVMVSDIQFQGAQKYKVAWNNVSGRKPDGIKRRRDLRIPDDGYIFCFDVERSSTVFPAIQSCLFFGCASRGVQRNRPKNSSVFVITDDGQKKLRSSR